MSLAKSHFILNVIVE